MPQSRSVSAPRKTKTIAAQRRRRLTADEVGARWTVEVNGDGGRLVFLCLELLDGVDGRGRGIADRGGDLPRQLRPHVAGCVEPGQACLHGRVGHQESQRVMLQVLVMVE